MERVLLPYSRIANGQLVDRATIRAPAEGFNTCGVFHTGDRQVNAANQASVDGYTLLDLGVSYEVDFNDHPTVFRLNAYNVTGEEYWAATGSGIIQQGTPSVVKFSASTAF